MQFEVQISISRTKSMRNRNICLQTCHLKQQNAACGEEAEKENSQESRNSEPEEGTVFGVDVG